MNPASASSSSSTDLVGLHTGADGVRHLMSSAHAASLLTLIGVAFVLFGLHGQVERSHLALWGLAMAALACVRYVYRLIFQRKFEPATAARWKTGYAVIAGCTGLAWGVLSWLPGIGAGQPLLSLTTVILLSVLLIGSSTLIASKSAYFSFVLALILPLSLAVGWREETDGLLFGMAVGAGCGLIFIINRMHFRALRAAFHDHHESRQLLLQQRVIFESAGEGIVLVRPAPEYTVECNRRFAEIFGYTPGQLSGMEPWRWHPDREQWRLLVAASLPAIKAGKAYCQSMQLRRADNTLFWADVTGMAIEASDPNKGTVWVVSDLSAKRAAETALRIAEKRLRDLVKISSDIYWEQDDLYRFTRFDGRDEILGMIGHGNRHLGKCRWEMDILADSIPIDWENHRAQLARHEPFRDLVYPITAANGEKRWLTVSGNPLFDGGGRFTGYHGVATDITERVASEEHYRHMAYHDPLTQLPNRRLLEDRMAQAIRVAHRGRQRLAVLLIDLDGFKQVNDVYGHATGDEVLKVSAARLTEVLRDSDTVARLGGDEFVILLSDLFEVSHATLVAEKIHAALAQPLPVSGVEVRVAASIGIAFYPDHGNTPQVLLDCADYAMYHGKQAGGLTTRVFAGPQPATTAAPAID